MRHSPARPGLLLVTLALSLFFASSSFAATSEIVSGIGVFLDDPASPGTPSTLKRSDENPGDIFAVHVLTDVAAAAPFPGAGGARFKVDLDPRLIVLSKAQGADISLGFETQPDEWDVAFTNCSDGRVHLVSYWVQLPDDGTNLDNIRVDVSAPSSGPMAISTCSGNTRLNRAVSAGGVLINPTSPSIVHFSQEKYVHVEGRDLKLAWETAGSSSVSLDGVGVPSTGSIVDVPTSSRSYTLNAGSGVASQVNVELIRTPRVNFYTVELIPPSNTQVLVSWDIDGADVAQLEGVGAAVGAFGTRTLPLLNPPDYDLQASNEWGTTAVRATLEDVSELEPVVLHFGIEPSFARFGTDVVLSWSVFNADQVQISPDVGSVDPVQGSAVVTVTGEGTYTLTASNANGVDVATANLTIAPPVVVALSANPQHLYPGGSVELSWDVEGAETLEILPDPGLVDPSLGSVSVIPDAPLVRYTATATSAGGTDEMTVDVFWLKPVAQISANSTDVYGGSLVDFELNIEGADAATLTPDVGAIEPIPQTLSVVVDESALYRLEAQNAAGTTAATVQITAHPPDVELEASSTVVGPGSLVTLTATIQGAQSASLEPGVGAIDPSGGSFQVQVDETTVYELSATNPAGTSTTTIEVMSTADLPVIVGFGANPSEIVEGESSTLSWEVSNATQVEILPIGHVTTDLQGSIEVAPATDTTFRLIASNAVSSVEATATLMVEEHDLAIVNFQANPSVIVDGESAALNWFVRDADHITIEPGGFSSTQLSGSWPVTPTETTEYTLTAFHGPIAVQATTTVVVEDFRIENFVAIPLVVLPGDPVTLSWQVSGIASVSIDGFGTQPMVGSLVVTPSETTTYILRAQNGSVQKTRQVTVSASTGTEPGVLVMSGDEDGTQTEINMPVGEVVTVYAVLRDGDWGGVLGMEYGLVTHPAVFLLSEMPVILGSLDLGPGHTELILGLPSCLRFDDPVAIMRYEMVTFDPIPYGETLLGFRGANVPPNYGSEGLQLATCANQLVEIEDFVDLTSGGGVVSVLSIDLELEQRPSGRAVRWEMNGQPERLRLYRGESRVGMTAIADLSPSASGEWLDTGADPKRAEFYRIEAEVGGDRVSSEIVQAEPATPQVAGVTRLLANIPNPFNPATEIRFVLEKPGSASVDIYDLSGRRVFVRPFSSLPAGEHSFVWGGLDLKGRSVSSGVYLVRLRTDGTFDSRSITLVE